jgi:hypothetical protein
VRNGFVTAAGLMLVRGFVGTAGMRGRARRGVRRSNGQHALIGVALMRVMQVTVMGVVDMVAMPNAGVPTTRAVNVVVRAVRVMAHARLRCERSPNSRWRARCESLLELRLQRVERDAERLRGVGLVPTVCVDRGLNFLRREVGRPFANDESGNHRGRARLHLAEHL